MLNLLPKNKKNKITREYRIRFWVIVLALAFAGEIISLILLAPSYLTVQTRINILNSESAGLKAQNLTVETTNLSNTIRQTNSYINILNSSSTPVGAVDAFQKIVSIRGKAVRIGSFFYRTNNGQQQIVISGNADSRQALLDFAKNLKNQPGVISANLPVSDFAKAQNIDFSISILMKPQHI
jgi:nitrate reductase NapAB chaperone NapD